MTKTIISALIATSALIASPAMAATGDVTGTINVTGTVGARCSVIAPGGTVENQAYTGTIDLKRLDAADGTLRSTLAGAATAADGIKVNARIVCTSANPTVGVIATKLNTGGATDPGAGYSNDIDYTAQIKVKAASGAYKTVTYSTLTDTTAKTATLGERIAGGSADNVEVSIFNLASEAGATSLLASGTYTSTVTVTIQPTV